MLNYRDEDVTLDHHAEIRKEIVIEEVEEPELGLKHRAMTVLMLTEGLGLTEPGIKVFEDTDSKEQCTKTTAEVIMRMFACCEEILKEKRSVSPPSSVLNFFT